ncbi:MAG: extracellular solute-binding protein [Anaerolineae bacterium]|nr:extracellular solute-binding protein [Anaerolineae bacterium]
MSRKLSMFLALCLILTMVVGALPASAQDKVQIIWFVGLGTGGQPEQQEMQNQIVEEFNASQDRIELQIVIADNNVAPDTLATLIASGDAPDIVGPVGTTGSNRFYGSWLDLEPVAEAVGYDLTQFPEASVDYYRTSEGLIGLPFATFPSFLWYRPELFDEAGLDYPPTAYGEDYADGEPWDWNKVRELAMELTVDAEGYAASEDEFDASNAIQWGFSITWSDPRGYPTHFGSGHVYNEETGEAQMPEHWADFYNWMYTGVWEEGWYPNNAQDGSDLLAAGNAFSSGNLAMTTTHLWYTCCIEDDGWDAAPMPSWNGETTAKLHADTFRILNTTEHPEEAFEVLAYLIGDASLDLLSVYGGMPAREADRDAFFADLDEKYPQGVNWDVVMDSLNYADSPSHEAWMPNFNKAEDTLHSFTTLIWSTPDLDINAELETLVADLQAVFDEVSE